MCGMFMYSADGGNIWSTPERFTPTYPLLDWRYISIVPVSPVNNDIINVHLVMQGDTIPGSSINGWSLMPPYIAAQYYHFSTEFPLVNVQDEPKPFSSFKLEQNYPNPFNPSTKIKFTVPFVETHRDASLPVTLKVYDILGNEIATLINEELSPGEYEVEFSGHSDEGQNLPSGVYFYQLRTKGPETSSQNEQTGQGIFQTKKMILIK